MQLALSEELDAVHGFAGAPVGGLKELARQRQRRIPRYTQKEPADILSAGSCCIWP